MVRDAPQQFLTPIGFVREMTMAIFRQILFVSQTAIDRRQNMGAVVSAESKSSAVFAALLVQHKIDSEKQQFQFAAP